MNAELAMALGMLPAYIPSTVWDDIPGMNLSKIANAISDVGGMCLMAFHCYVRGIRMCCPVLIHNVLPSSLNCQGYISIVKPFLDAHQVALGEILQRAAVDHRSVLTRCLRCFACFACFACVGPIACLLEKNNKNLYS